MRWHILTGEYPPHRGGVADYTQLVAQGLSACGDAVDVWAPGDTGGPEDSGVVRHQLPDHFGPRSLGVLTRHLRRERGGYRLLVQYVPHAFGWKGSNVPFCLWLRAQPRESTWVMFHEVAFPLRRRQRLAHNGLGLVTRGMAALVASAASRAFVSIPAWEPMIRRSAAAATPIEWMPVPSAIPVEPAADVRAVRDRFATERPIVGHFGTYGGPIRSLLFEAVRQTTSVADVNVLLIGRGSDVAAADIAERWPDLRGRVLAVGAVSAREVSQCVSACDVMVQPYVDGVSTRRTSVMVALAHGRAVVTTSGELTEQVWGQGAVSLCPVGDAAAMARACAAITATPALATRLGAEAKALYDSRFDLRHTIAMLREVDPSAAQLQAVS